jgi:F-type H+-transporting ATPase subunit epsilon
MSQLSCTIVTPEETALDERADFVALPLYDGEIGIGLDHTPLIGRLGYGELRLRKGDSVTRYYVDGGFVQIAENSVAVLTNRAIPAHDIDTSVAEEQLQSGLKRAATTPDQFETRDRIIAQARAQLRVAHRAK